MVDKSWKCRIKDDPYTGDWHVISAPDKYEAAEKMCKREDEGGDYSIVENFGANVEVTLADGTTENVWVESWAKPIYQAIAG